MVIETWEKWYNKSCSTHFNKSTNYLIFQEWNKNGEDLFKIVFITICPIDVSSSSPTSIGIIGVGSPVHITNDSVQNLDIIENYTFENIEL